MPTIVGAQSTRPFSLLEPSLVDEYSEWFRDQAGQEDLVGAAFVIVSGDGVLRVGTFGHTDTTKKQQVDANTAFRLASVSKTFAAGLTAQLVSDGSLDWDDPVTRYVPGFRISGDTSQIRIRHLLGQSTGLIPHAYDNLIEDGMSAADVQIRMADLTPICSPGHCYSYQNSVFSLIEPVIETVTSQTYARLIEQRIFKPLNMQNASVGYEAFLATPNRAEPHVKRSGHWTTVQVLPNYYRVGPAAGVNASITDMGRWLMAQLGAHPQVFGTEAISAVSRPRVKTPRELYRKEWKRLLTDAHYGLGWRVYQLNNEQLVYHSGWVSGYRADAAWSARHDLGIAVLVNAETSFISTLTTRFWEMVFDDAATASAAASP